MHKMERNCETQTEKQPSDYGNNIQQKYNQGSLYRPINVTVKKQ